MKPGPLFLIALLLLGCPGRALADADSTAESRTTQPETFKSGARLRLTGRSGRVVVGIVQSVAADSIRYTLPQDNSRVWSTAWTSLTRVERSVARRRHTLRGMAIGLAAGLGVGLIVSTGVENTSSAYGPEGMEKAGAILGGAEIGLITGWLVGRTRTDQWEPVLFPPPPEPPEAL
jgi:hypothetical protein